MLPNLKKLRAEYGISQQKLADAIHVSQPSINKYENHNIEPEFEILIRMADYFETSVDYLIGHTDERRKAAAPRSMDREEEEVLLRYRSLSEEEKQCIQLMLRTLSRR